jgi:hypothetical protein
MADTLPKIVAYIRAVHVGLQGTGFGVFVEKGRKEKKDEKTNIS